METANSPALLLLDLPKSALAGIDLLAFTVTPRFHGVKDLPPGFHFAFAGTTSAFSERHGLWFRIPSKAESRDTPLFVTKWDVSTEALKAETDDAERLRWRANLGSIWREGLTPYRQTTSKTAAADDDDEEEELNDWPTLTSAITGALLSRITGGDPTRWYLTSASSAKRDLEDIPGLDEHDLKELQGDKDLCLLLIDLKQTWREGATGRERTQAAQDRSWALENIKKYHCADGDIKEIIGELQFCFLMILTINNFSCLEQWRRILTLIFTCRSAVSENSDFFINAISALRLQLQHCKDAEGGLIDLADESGSLLKDLLVRFRKGLEGMTGTGVSDVVDELDDLEDYLRQDHGWQFGGDFARSGVLELEDGEQVQMESTAFDEDDETGEFAPQMVDLTPEQARLLGITPEDTRDLGASLSKASIQDKVADVVQDSGDEEETDDSSGEEDMQDLDEMASRF
ncbi:A1 cistron-splicing factor aar2 [Fulvia fulva]|uniref:A1 cistron-splicing factor aar2 n=1 Tax=Passalora fulva TaxID=5499 RepID=A0A9Q8PC10_PASFU|nr:A1 cistron-splicing factor aar2 [Fulvia fulva]KAK4619852.1 A1 cistron-splicing factor aar2 [Fulvia fulva]KAK4621130.1 A1 cistron-splicing factor aar2 [Fulvia fulva]UJO19769.1 A1 cistron-splicing factor aar2 [Fulvia fulva]WPV17705.1 A1 cistron-splicing factor aar2 [Fulvia fulva]WPV32407.1 A1 cistron-splicing factor aar2 [Fulvia fulva]